MITRIKIDGFKSFSNFEVELKPFNVIVGANGSGKSNLLDALHLLRSLTEGSIAEAFSKQRGTPSELFTRYPDGNTAQEMSFEVDIFNYATLTNYIFTRRKNEVSNYCLRLQYSFTIIKTDDALVLKKERLSTIPIEEDTWVKREIPLVHQASWMKLRPQDNKTFLDFNKEEIVHSLLTKGINYGGNYFIYTFVKGTFQNWKFLDLNPKQLSLPSSKFGAENLQEDGSNLAATLQRITKNNPAYLQYISNTLANLLPAYKEVKVVADEIQDMYYILVQANDGTWFNARVLSEGTLRMLALVVLQFDDKNKGTFCLEEPENGVHPFRIKAILELLQELSTDLSQEAEDRTPFKQVILNTHSPVLLSKALKLKGNIGLFYSEMVTSINAQRSVPMKVTRLYPILKKANDPSKITMEMGGKRLYAKQVIDYLNSADLEH